MTTEATQGKKPFNFSVSQIIVSGGGEYVLTEPSGLNPDDTFRGTILHNPNNPTLTGKRKDALNQADWTVLGVPVDISFTNE